MASPDVFENASIDDVDEYYRNSLGPENSHLFKNLDDAASLEPLLISLQSSNARNLVLDFSDRASWVCFDATAQVVNTLLNADRPDILNTRWINIWQPTRQRSLLDLFGKHYDFSPRLLALMCSDPREQCKLGSDNDLKTNPSQKRRRFVDTASVVENGPDGSSEGSSVTSYDSVSRANLYKIITDLWHYFGRNYVCVGYNSHYGAQVDSNISSKGSLPNYHGCGHGSSFAKIILSYQLTKILSHVRTAGLTRTSDSY